MSTRHLVLRTIALLILAIATPARAEDAPLLSILRLPLAGPGSLDELQRQVSLDFIDVGPSSVMVAANRDEIALIQQNGIRHEVVYPDAEDLVLEERPLGGVGAYHTYESVCRKLEAWAAGAPAIATLRTIGTSVEGRAIPALKLEAASTAPVPTADRPKVLIMGLHHAREWISAEVPMALAQRLIEGHATDASIRELLENRTVWIVPVVNPDGLEFSQKKYSMWRKNRHKTWSLPFTNGVDPNRNYGFHFTGPGSSSMPFSEVYRGPGPFSEPETSALRDLAQAERFTASISFHSYSELVLYPWGYSHDPCPDAATFEKLGREMAAINHYRPQTGADLYLVNGEADDWLYGALGAFAFTIELGKSFIPRDADIPKITGPNVEAALHLIRASGDLNADPIVCLNLAERLAGAGWAPRGPWSPGAIDESLRRRTLDWSVDQLARRVAACAEAGRSGTLRELGARLARHGSGAPPELVRAVRRALQAAPAGR
jgi:hypothetical protein